MSRPYKCDYCERVKGSPLPERVAPAATSQPWRKVIELWGQPGDPDVERGVEVHVCPTCWSEHWSLEPLHEQLRRGETR